MMLMAKEYTAKELSSKVEKFMLEKIGDYESIKASRCTIDSKKIVSCMVKITDLESSETRSEWMSFPLKQIGT